MIQNSKILKIYNQFKKIILKQTARHREGPLEEFIYLDVPLGLLWDRAKRTSAAKSLRSTFQCLPTEGAKFIYTWESFKLFLALPLLMYQGTRQKDLLFLI